MLDVESIKLCECGCGNPAPIAKRTNKSQGRVRGEPVRFIQGHNITNVKHGMERTRIYRTWESMLTRCRNPNSDKWHRYGARGISVCERWLDFRNFYEDMGDRPDGMSIDRVDNDGDYEPGNCRWATRKQQQNNRHNNLWLEAFGQTKTLAEWSRQFGLLPQTVSRRIVRGLPIEVALSKKSISRRKKYKCPDGDARNATAQD